MATRYETPWLRRLRTRVLASVAVGASLTAVARRECLDTDVVRLWCAQYRVPYNLTRGERERLRRQAVGAGPRQMTARRARIYASLRAGRSAREIAAAERVSRETVGRYRREMEREMERDMAGAA